MKIETVAEVSPTNWGHIGPRAFAGDDGLGLASTPEFERIAATRCGYL